MLRGYNRPRKSDIFGPSSTGGRINHAGQRDVYQEGEGIGGDSGRLVQIGEIALLTAE